MTENNVRIEKWSEYYEDWYLYLYFVYTPTVEQAEKALNKCKKENPSEKFRINWNCSKIDWIEQ